MKIRLLGDIWSIEPEVSLSISEDFPRITIGNLETPLIPLTQDVFPQTKAGPTLRGWPHTVEKLIETKNGLRCLTLANNHTMDYGYSGLRSTLSICQEYNVRTIGAGKDLSAAERPIILNVDGVKVGILACCETQCGIADLKKPGVAPFSPRLYKAIALLKSQVDFVTVSIHGAIEMSPWPSPQWQDRLRSLIEAGANLVHAHHAHVPQGYECYEHGLIFYGLGNFLVNPADWKNNNNTLWSIIADCPILPDYSKIVDWEFSTVRTTVISEMEGVVCVRDSSKSESEKHCLYLKKCNQPLSNRSLLLGLWQEISVWLYRDWYAQELGFAHKKEDFKIFLKKTLHALRGDSDARLRKENLLRYVLLRCESHHEAITTALALLSGEVEDFRSLETKKLINEMMPSF